MPSYLWHSPSTGEYINITAKIDEREIVPLDPPGDWVRVFEMPGVLRKTYLDGQRKDMIDFKKISKLELAKADLAHNDPQRKDIDQEISGRRKIGKKESAKI